MKTINASTRLMAKSTHSNQEQAPDDAGGLMNHCLPSTMSMPEGDKAGSTHKMEASTKPKFVLNAAARLKATEVVAADDNGDKERAAQLVTQIRDIEQDVKEIEDDGDDATVERKHLEKLRDEQRRLKEKMGVGISARLQRLAARRTGK